MIKIKGNLIENPPKRMTSKSYRKKPIIIRAIQFEEEFEVETKEGTMRGKPGDFLIFGIERELYPCDKKIFEKTYEEIE